MQKFLYKNKNEKILAVSLALLLTALPFYVLMDTKQMPPKGRASHKITDVALLPSPLLFTRPLSPSPLERQPEAKNILRPSQEQDHRVTTSPQLNATDSAPSAAIATDNPADIKPDLETQKLNLNITAETLKGVHKESKSAIKQHIEEETYARNKQLSGQLANDMHNAQVVDCAKRDYGVGLFNLIPLAIDVLRKNCPQ